MLDDERPVAPPFYQKRCLQPTVMAAEGGNYGKNEEDIVT